MGVSGYREGQPQENSSFREEETDMVLQCMHNPASITEIQDLQMRK
jgi:hypothetical protein